VADPHASSKLTATIGINKIIPDWEGGVIVGRFLIESPHTLAECLRAMDEVLAQGPEELARYDWGCLNGDHTGYAIIEACSKQAAEVAVPAFLRYKTRIVELNKFMPEQVRAFHHGL
jgi:hypothetical protein